jgi:hypothetical protein
MKFQEDIRTPIFGFKYSSLRDEKENYTKKKESSILAVSVCLSPWNNSRTGEWIFIRFGIREFY